jgi:hypothetical protein
MIYFNQQVHALYKGAKMKSPNLLLISVAFAVLGTSALAKSKSDIRDVTGCLSPGNSAKRNAGDRRDVPRFFTSSATEVSRIC